MAILAMMMTFSAGTAPAKAAELYVSDSAGHLGTVDVQTGAVDVIGDMGVTMTDIAFDANGNLFGISFTDFYLIDADDASIMWIGSHSIPWGNALVFATNGTLYAASSTTTDLYTIDTGTGSSTSLGNIGFQSAGDLAFNGGDFYMSSLTHELIRIDLSNNANGTVVGPFGFGYVYGLATASTGVLYGVDTSSQIFTVDPVTGDGTLTSSFSNQGLNYVYGSSFLLEAVPEPASLALLGLGGLLLAPRRTRDMAYRPGAWRR